MTKERINKMYCELADLQVEFEEKNIICTFREHSPINFRKYWLSVEHTDGVEFFETWFACETLAELKEAIKYVFKETSFAEVKALCYKSTKGDTLEHSLIPTFYALESDSDHERDFEHYFRDYE